MNFTIYTCIVLIFVFTDCGICESNDIEFNSPHDVYYADGDTLNVRIITKMIPEGVTQFVTYFGEQKMDTFENNEEIILYTVLYNVGNFYIQLMKNNVPCEKKPVIYAKNGGSNNACLGTDSTQRCRVTVDLNNTCKEEYDKINENAERRVLLKTELKKKSPTVSTPYIPEDTAIEQQRTPEQDVAGSGNTIIKKLEAKFNNEKEAAPYIINEKYGIGDMLHVTCNSKDTILWHMTDRQRKNDFGSIPECYSGLCKLELQLELFDDGTHIFCMSKADGLVSPFLVLQLNDPPSRLEKTTTEELYYYGENESDLFKCNQRPNQTITVILPNERLDIDNLSHEFKLTETKSGSRLACINYTTEIRSSSVGKVSVAKRNKYNYKLYLFKDGNPNVDWKYIIAAVVGGVILVSIVVFLVLKCKKRTERTSHEVETYACVNRVEYADLEMLQTNSRINIKTEDRSPYAQVIGVLAPKK